MIRLLVLASACASLVACTYDPVTGTWYNKAGWAKPTIETAQSDPLEHRLAVQRYAREHDGKLPPPDVVVNP